MVERWASHMPLHHGRAWQQARCGQSKEGTSTLASMRRMANSAQTVLPDPVGAATRQLSSVLYSAVNTCAHYVPLLSN